MIKKKNIYAIIYKSIKDLLKNKTLFLINFMFPLLALLFKLCFSEEKAREPMLSFCTMNAVMIPILILSSIIAEEKEKGTLRALISIGVKPIEYLLGVSTVTFLSAFVSALFFVLLIPIKRNMLLLYIVYISFGIIASTLIGCIIGIYAQNQVKVGATAAPISMVIGMLPVFSEVNFFLKKISKVFYSGILTDYLVNMEKEKAILNCFYLGCNIIIILVFFYFIYRKKGLCER